jgi:hypothetical protein
MRKLLLVVLLAFAGQATYAQGRELNINVSTLNETIKGKWFLQNANPANAIPFQEFTVKGPGFGSIGKLKSDGKGLEQIVCKIILGNADITFNDADGEHQVYRITELSKTSVKMSNGTVTLVFVKS